MVTRASPDSSCLAVVDTTNTGSDIIYTAVRIQIPSCRAIVDGRTEGNMLMMDRAKLFFYYGSVWRCQGYLFVPMSSSPAWTADDENKQKSRSDLSSRLDSLFAQADNDKIDAEHSDSSMRR